MTRTFYIIAAAGNRFALLDARGGLSGEPPARIAQRVCGELGVDGLLLCASPRAGGALRMVLYNPDGSRPEACGNGLRCLTRAAREWDIVSAKSFVIETDAGPRRVTWRGGDASSGAVLVSTGMGTPRFHGREVVVETGGGRPAAKLTRIDLGNPHAVLFVPDLDAAPVEELGAALQGHDHFPNGVNVEFVSVRESVLHVRIFERGVGETESCGTGVAASAVAAIDRGLVSSPVTVHTRGGTLRVGWKTRGEAELTGPVDELQTVQFAGRP